jgi:hypothetical protein
MEVAKSTPVWRCDVKTLRALQKRGLVVLDEVRKICFFVKQEGV